MQELGIKSSILREIQAGQKTVEGRLAKGRFLKINEGDILQLREDIWDGGQIVSQLPSPTKIEVTKLLRFKSFAEMLDTLGVQNVIPSAPNVEEAVAVYRQFYTEADEREYGVVALVFRVVEP